MEVRFTIPSLRRLDLSGTEVLVATLTSDERPPHGVAGLVDWRLAGRLSRLLQANTITGELGEVVLIPGKPKLPFEKVLLFGVGARQSFDEEVFRSVVQRICKTLEGLEIRTAVVELPGRHFGAIDADRAADVVLDIAAGRRKHDLWTLVESAEAQRRVQQHMVQERRRLRRG